MKWRNYAGTHATANCKEEKRYNLCGKEGHIFRKCPELYASVAKRQSTGQQEGVKREEEAGEEGTVQQQEAAGSLKQWSVTKGGTTKEADDLYIAEYSSSESGDYAEEEEEEEDISDADSQMEVMLWKECTQKRIRRANIASTAGKQQRAESSHVLVGTPAVINSPVNPTRGVEVESVDFQGSAFLEEGAVQSCFTMCAFYKPAVVAQRETENKDKMSDTNKLNQFVFHVFFCSAEAFSNLACICNCEIKGIIHKLKRVLQQL
ncbi:UNVERIFIED_CONTAM: hypothetical protein FKN15_028096 [Acipenser sinensis]